MKNRHSIEQIIRILGEIEKSGVKISDSCRPHGITEQTYYRWRKKYGKRQSAPLLPRWVRVVVALRYDIYDE